MNYDSGVISEATSSLTTIEKSIISIKEKFNENVALISSNWTSPASTELKKNMNNSLEQFQTYIDEMDKIIKSLDSIVTDIENTEAANKALIDSANI